MIRVTKAVVRKWVEMLLHTHDTPKRTAAAFALGVFMGFSPFLGLHTALAVCLAFALRLNRVAAAAGCYVNLPWVIAPYYTLTTVLAAETMGIAMPDRFASRLGSVFELSFATHAFWQGLGQLLHPLLWPFLIGSTCGAALLAAVTYVVAVPAIAAGRRHLHLPHRHPHHEEIR
jgi:uncharacterized protein (DUF2062 family)